MSCKDSEGAGFVCAYGWVTLWLAFHTNLQRKKHCGWAGGDLLQTHPAAVCCYTAVTHLGNKSNVEKMEKNGEKNLTKVKKPKEVMYWGKKKPKLNEQMASCCQKDTEPGNIYLNYFHCDRFPNHSDWSSASPGWDLGWCIQSYLAS